MKATTLQAIADQYGQDIVVQSVEQLRFLDNNATYLSREVFWSIGKCDQ